MRMDVRIYRTGLDAAKHIYKKYEKEPTKAIAMVSQFMSCPLIVSLEYARTYIFGDTPEIMKMRQSLIDFYKYSEVVGFDDSSDPTQNS